MMKWPDLCLECTKELNVYFKEQEIPAFHILTVDELPSHPIVINRSPYEILNELRLLNQFMERQKSEGTPMISAWWMPVSVITTMLLCFLYIGSTTSGTKYDAEMYEYDKKILYKRIDMLERELATLRDRH